MLALDDGALSQLVNVGNYNEDFYERVESMELKQETKNKLFKCLVYYNIKNNTYIGLVKIAWFESLLLHHFLNTLVTSGTCHEILTDS